MSILCCRIPHFCFALHAQKKDPFVEPLVALVGPEEQIEALSPLAAQAGVRIHSSLQQARLHCPDLIVHQLDVALCQDAQRAFLEAIQYWGLPVEETSWGEAYLDMSRVAPTLEDAQATVKDVGMSLRETLGKSLEPALGLNCSKFTSRLAAYHVQPGHMRLVPKKREKPFLSPLPLTWLPLSGEACQMLQWLGIQSLGQFASLPTPAVWQRFGHAGYIAQQWAKGHDNRRVRATLRRDWQPIEIRLDPPTGLLHRAVDECVEVLHPHVRRLANRLEGIRQLALGLNFVDASQRSLTLHFMHPTTEESLLRRNLEYHFRTLNWPDELDQITIAELSTGELPVQQPSLFDEIDETAGSVDEFVRRLQERYGEVVYCGRIVNEQHPLFRYRSVYSPFTT